MKFFEGWPTHLNHGFICAMGLKQKLSKWQLRLGEYIGRPGYVVLMAGVAALNAFLAFIPVEVFIILRVLIRPKSWWRMALLAAVCSSLATYVLARLVETQPQWANWLASYMGPVRWHEASQFINEHGTFGLFLGAVTLLPLPPAVVICVMAKVPNSQIALSIGAGNLIKYCFIARLAAFSPHRFGQKEAKAVC